jgi:hypothetical protein
MRHYLIRFLLALVLTSVLAVDSQAQKRSKKRPAPARHSDNRAPQNQPAKDDAVDMSSAAPAPVPIPQESSLKPKLNKTKKVVIVPAPPPPPGPDPVPPYPKR